MSFAYFPHTDEDIRQMLERIGVTSLEDLYADVPAEIRYTREFDLPDSLSEIELRRKFEELDRKNNRLTVFCGCGAYDHYAPAVIPSLIARSEYLTAYTPYQAEISQGTLRYIFEYQSMITELTGMDCTNASMYDGPTAAAEAMLMAMAATKKKKRVLLADTLLPQVREVVKTYAKYHGVEIGRIAQKDGNTDLESLQRELESGDVAGALIPSINRFGIIEDLSGMADALHAAKALLMVYADPSALAVIKTPGEWGADITCGDAQTLGLPLLALYVTIYLSLMGPEGLRQVNALSYGGAHELHDRLIATGLFEEVFDKPFLKEFVLKSKIPAATLQQALLQEGFLAALETEEGYVSFCVTEKRNREEIDRMLSIIKQLKP